MTKNRISPKPTSEWATCLEGRVALRMTAYLDDSTNQLPDGVSERLRVAREQAVVRARSVRQSTLAPASIWVQMTSTLAFGGFGGRGWRVASVLPLLALVAGLVAIHQHHDHEQILLAAELDAAILADELPPAAYRDPGFSAFLQAQDVR